MVDVSNLFIDKLCLAYRCGRETGTGIIAMIRDYQQSRELPIQYLGPYYQNRGYRYNWHLQILGHGNNSRVLLMADPVRNPNAAYFIMEWNPNNLGNDGNEALWDILELILLDDLPDFINSAIVTRIDFAVDVSPMTPESIWVAADSLRRGDLMTGDHGDIQSIGLGSRGSATSYCIYNRDQASRERISQNQFCTRIEARHKPMITLQELHSIAISNPFSRLLIEGAVDPIELDNDPDRYRIFLDSVRLRGLQGALQIFRNLGTRHSYRRWIQENLLTDWFNPNQIWEDYNQAFEVLALERFLGPQRWRISGGRRIRQRVHGQNLGVQAITY